ncbi:MAG: hypothetical protein CM1200mP12_09210 [Gammaproteobacteria bacterium]|nr:MAG: hypothetical protein CM1200mP12_09210 [Gammaproteobacteria bacterium]
MVREYTAESIEVLSGLDPVRKRPGMYTETSRPNHLALEVIDNSVDEALAGYATKIDVQLHKDGSLSVVDDGRGMPVDVHPEEGIPGVELIFSRLHAGAKFSNVDYKFSGGLHGVGVSVVNALSSKLSAEIKRGGKKYLIEFKNSEKSKELKEIDKVGKKNTGTKVTFLPDPDFFDSVKISANQLILALKAKAVLCPGLTISFKDEASGKKESWCFLEGLAAYLVNSNKGGELIPTEPFEGEHMTEEGGMTWAIQWVQGIENPISDSYVNLIPTPQGGTHVNGLRSGLTDALKEFCEFRNLVPRGVKLTADDIWVNCSSILSAKLKDPQFTGQTKEGPFLQRKGTGFISTIIKDVFSLWLNQHTAEGEEIAQLSIQNAQKKTASKKKKVTRKKITSGPVLPGKLTDCTTDDFEEGGIFFWLKEIQLEVQPNRLEIELFKLLCP